MAIVAIGGMARGGRGRPIERLERTNRSSARGSDDPDRARGRKRVASPAPSPPPKSRAACRTASGDSASSDNDNLSGDSLSDDGGDTLKRKISGAPSSRSFSTPVKTSDKDKQGERDGAKATSASEMSPMEFMQAKASLMKQVKEAIVYHSSNKGVLERVKLAGDKLTPSQIDALSKTPTDVCGDIQKHIDAVAAFEKRLIGAKSVGWGELQMNVETALDSLKSEAHKGEQEYKAMQFLLGIKTRADKARKNACGFLKRRISWRLVSGGGGIVRSPPCRCHREPLRRGLPDPLGHQPRDDDGL